MKKVNSYKNSGVNISLGNKFVKHISKLTSKSVQKEKNSSLNNIGGFASIFDLTKKIFIVSCTGILKGCKIAKCNLSGGETDEQNAWW